MKHCLISTPSSVIEEPLKDGITHDKLPDIVTHTLPQIIPHIATNKRQDIIPLIVSAIRLQSDPMERENLIRLLFNIQKKPDEEERQIILAGLFTLNCLNLTLKDLNFKSFGFRSKLQNRSKII